MHIDGKRCVPIFALTCNKCETHNIHPLFDSKRLGSHLSW